MHYLSLLSRSVAINTDLQKYLYNEFRMGLCKRNSDMREATENRLPSE